MVFIRGGVQCNKVNALHRVHTVPEIAFMPRHGVILNYLFDRPVLCRQTFLEGSVSFLL